VCCNGFFFFLRTSEGVSPYQKFIKKKGELRQLKVVHARDYREEKLENELQPKKINSICLLLCDSHFLPLVERQEKERQKATICWFLLAFYLPCFLGLQYQQRVYTCSLFSYLLLFSLVRVLTCCLSL
jgi:hypothetical protein